jgi:hypothetical protein
MHGGGQTQSAAKIVVRHRISGTSRVNLTPTPPASPRCGGDRPEGACGRRGLATDGGEALFHSSSLPETPVRMGFLHGAIACRVITRFAKLRASDVRGEEGRRSTTGEGRLFIQGTRVA